MVGPQSRRPQPRVPAERLVAFPLRGAFYPVDYVASRMVRAVTSVPIPARVEENPTAFGGKRSSVPGGRPMAIERAEVLRTAHRKVLMRSDFHQAFVVSPGDFRWSPSGPRRSACVIDLWTTELVAMPRLWTRGPKGGPERCSPELEPFTAGLLCFVAVVLMRSVERLC